MDENKTKIKTIKIISKYRKLLHFERGSKSEALLLEMSIELLNETIQFLKNK